MSTEDKIKLLNLQINYLKETRDNSFSLIKGLVERNTERSDTSEQSLKEVKDHHYA